MAEYLNYVEIRKKNNDWNSLYFTNSYWCNSSESTEAYLETPKINSLLFFHTSNNLWSTREVQAGKVWMEMDNVEKGIVQLVAQHNIRWLVMGAAADKHYSKYETSTLVT